MKEARVTLVPEWSFLAVEPFVRSVIRRHPDLFQAFLNGRKAVTRSRAFWKIFAGVEAAIARKTPWSIPSRRRLATQTVYALVDIAKSNIPDRDVQRILRSVLGQEGVLPQSAVVASRANSHPAA